MLTVHESKTVAAMWKDVDDLKRLARHFLHPEIGMNHNGKQCDENNDGVVCVDVPTATARCYFDRPSAPQTLSRSDADGVCAVLADAKALSKLAMDYMHPEVGLGGPCCDGTVYGRNYFNRPSAIETESLEETKEREEILRDAAELKKLAGYYLHPEVSVCVDDPTAATRCYFDRPSALGNKSMVEKFIIVGTKKTIEKTENKLQHHDQDGNHCPKKSASEEGILNKRYHSPSAVVLHGLEDILV